ncbi:MAG: cation:proton antiporter [Rhodospirillaceae bacterium]|nr:cation:proton antiporter [Rhodospirillales bacterium]
MALFLLHASIIIGLPFALWRLGGLRHWVPLVVVQIAFGLALGPSGLGRLAPELWAGLFPPLSLTALDGLVWLGISYFAFATGLHFDLTEFHGRGRAFATTSIATFVVPTVAGTGVGFVLLKLVPEAAGAGAPDWAFTLGVGIAVGVTALPVLAAILREMHMHKTRLGAEALGCAAVNDAALWVMMAALLALAGGGDAWRAASLLALAIAYGVALWFGARPLLARLFHHAEIHGRINERDVVVLSVGLFASALVSELIGLHAVVGAFAFGAVVPKAVARDVLEKFESFLMVVLLPFFFIAIGLKTEFTVASGAGTVFAWTFVASVTAKMASAALPARAQGWAWPDALALGSLVGCKGLMELVVLTLLLDKGILSGIGFSGMVLMALATTALARPLAGLFLRR